MEQIKLYLSVPQSAHLFNGDHICLIMLLWGLNETVCENRTDQSLVRNKHAVTISHRYYSKYYSGRGRSVRTHLFLEEKYFEFLAR